MLGAHLDSWHGGDGRDRQRGRRRRGDGGRADPEGGRRRRRGERSGSRCGAARSRACSGRARTSRSTSRRKPLPKDPKERENFSLRRSPGPLTVKPEHAKLSAYFNIDNGTGKIRGIYVAGERRGRPDLRGLAPAPEGPRRDDRDDAQHARHRPRVVRRGGPARRSSSSRTTSSTRPAPTTRTRTSTSACRTTTSCRPRSSWRRSCGTRRCATRSFRASPCRRTSHARRPRRRPPRPPPPRIENRMPSTERNPMKKVLALLLLPALAGAATPASAPVTAAEKAAAKAITEDEIRGHTRFLASDLLEGRAPATRGDRLAQEYIQAQMEALGLEPGAPEGGWIQKVPLVGIVGKVPEKLSVSRGRAQGRVHEARGLHRVLRARRSRSRGSTPPRSSSSATGSSRPSSSGTTTRTWTSRARSSSMMNNDPEDDPKLVRRQDAALVRALGLQVLDRGAEGRRRRVHHPHRSRPPGIRGRSSRRPGRGERFELPYEGEPRVEIKGWFTEDASKKIAALGGPGPRPRSARPRSSGTSGRCRSA